ncbi:MAG TPA: branched-chain amino acid transaminase [Thermoanaerobaculia bacterium]|nr:branched-chain amino acid transaminase [Thermoanaerobaculia bacterium]
MAPPNPFANVRWIWKDGKLVEFEKATVHVLTHALHYGSGVFEGIRCYRTVNPETSEVTPSIFRLPEHLSRLVLSAKVYRMELPFSVPELRDAILETILGNGFEACYIRPLVFRGFGSMGVNPLRSPVEVVIAAWPWGKYLGDEALNQGVDACVSSWRRPSSSTLPAMAKATGNYLNSQLIKMEAVTNGFVEGIALDAGGYVSEGSGENLFLVQGGVLLTPPVSASMLPGITRDAIITLARDAGIEVREQVVPRGLLYTCDEMFFTGTAAEITPVRSVDRIAVGSGRPGEVTLRLAAEFMGIISGEIKDRHGWLYPVSPAAPAGPAGRRRGEAGSETREELLAVAGQPGADGAG